MNKMILGVSAMLMLALSARAQTPDLRTVTRTGNVTDTNIIVKNELGGAYGFQNNNGTTRWSFGLGTGGDVLFLHQYAAGGWWVSDPFFISQYYTVVSNRLLLGGVGDDQTSELQVAGKSYFHDGIQVNAPNSAMPITGQFGSGVTNEQMLIFGADANGSYVSSIKQGIGGANLIFQAQNNPVGGFGGNVGIGTTSPTEKLTVNGAILATKVTVKQSVMPDYVFESNYALPTLQELERYIAANKHLPDVPSAKEVAQNGLDVGDMEKSLLQKVEELTLYLLEEHKKNEALEVQLAEMSKRLEKLEQK
jgi:hypothetical protein